MQTTEQQRDTQPRARRVGQHRAAVRERKRSEVTVDCPRSPAMRLLARYVNTLETLARNDGEGVPIVTGTVEYDRTVYDRDSQSCPTGPDAADLLLNRAACFDAECVIFVQGELRRIEENLERFLEGKGR